MSPVEEHLINTYESSIISISDKLHRKRMGVNKLIKRAPCT